MLFANNHPD